MSNTEKLTPTEIIATKLLRWKLVDQYEDRRVYHLDLVDGDWNNVVVIDGKSHNYGWPDISTLDDCQLFEHALRDHQDKRLLHDYFVNLFLEFKQEDLPVRDTEEFVHTFSTPAQRVSACLITLEEAEDE